MARPNGDIPPDVSKLTVPKAAKALGISPEAVRNRLSRGTLESVKENGTVYVLLNTDRLHHTADQSDDIPGESGGLISAKDETIRVLREQLEAEREANRENRRIIAALTQRIPELPPAAPQEEAADGSVTVTEASGKGGVPPEPQAGLGERRSSWWRRLFS